MSAVSRMNGFQLTRRHAYTWSLWKLDYATAFESLLGEAGVNTVEARAAVEAWRECARLVHDFWRDISEVKQVQPLFYAWLSCVLRRVFDGTAEQVSTEQSLHVEVPVYTNEAWAQLPRDGATADDEKDKHVPRCGKVDVAVSAAGGSETVVVIELKAPSDPKWEGGRRCAAKGQVIVEAAAALAARSADACGETPMFGILTDMRFRLNALAFYPASPCTWVRQGGDDHENEDTDGYPPWTFAMTETSTAVDGNSSESSAAGSSADNAAEAWDGARAKRSGMVALVVLGLALCPDWDADGARNRVADVVAGEVEKFVEKTEAVLSLSETPDLDGSGLGDDESSRDGSGGGGAADGDASDADGASGGAPDSERGSSKGRGVATTTMAMVNMEADKPAEIVAEVDGETEVATVEVVIVEAIVAVAMAIVVQEFVAMQQRLEDINRSLLTGEYARRPPSSRSPSPPPQYDSFGKRTNTREIRRRSKLETERAELVERMRRNNPRWRPPPGLSGGGRRNYVTKVYFPVDEYPDFNFLGHVIGPRGSSLKQLEARTKARVQIRGRGSEKDGKRVLSQGSTEKLHAVITASTEEAMHAAKAEIEKLCNVVPEEENEHKRQQLMLLAQLNGTLTGTEFRIGRAITMPKFKAIGFKPKLHASDAQVSLDKKLALLGIDDNLISSYKSFMTKVGLAPKDLSPDPPERLAELEKLRAEAAATAAAERAAPPKPAPAPAPATNDDKLAAFLSTRPNKSWLSELFASWIYPLIAFGVKTPLELDHLPPLPEHEAAAHHINSFAAVVGDSAKLLTPPPAECDSGGRGGAGSATRRVPLLRYLIKAFRGIFLLQAVPLLFSIAFRVATPVALQKLLATITEPNPSAATAWRGVALVALVFCLRVGNTVARSQNGLLAYRAARGLKSVLRALVFDKSFRLASRAHRAYTTGEILNITSSDTNKLRSMAWGLNDLWSAPLLITGYICVLYWMFGPAVFAGIGLLAAVVPVNYYIFKKNERFWDVLSKRGDERVRIITDMLNGIRVLKLFAWEPIYARKVNEVRTVQVDILRSVKIYDAFVEVIWLVMPTAMALVTIAVYVYSGNPLSTASIFAGISTFHSMTHPMFNLPWAFMRLVEARISLRRLESFLSMPHLDGLDEPSASGLAFGGAKFEAATLRWGHMEKPPEEREAADADVSTLCLSCRPCGASGRSAAAEYHKLGTADGESSAADDEATGGQAASGSSDFELLRIDLAIPPGALVAVVGPVGAGKSSLLHALLGEMERVAGSVAVAGSIGYVAQNAWIQNATLRANILFGAPPDTARYAQVVAACALQQDLELLGGDLLEIGEKGINLSGGQRQRVALARAAYADKDVYLLDDPLSAVDPFCASKLFDECITGLLRNKTRVLVTHYLHLLPRVDYVVCMDGGRVVQQGTYDELMAQPSGAFAELVARHQHAAEEAASAGGLTPVAAPIPSPSGGLTLAIPAATLDHTLVSSRWSSAGRTPSPVARDMHLPPSDSSGVSPLLAAHATVHPRMAFPSRDDGLVSCSGSGSGSALGFAAATASPAERNAAFGAEASGSSGRQLVEDEDRVTGSISWRVYKRYLSAAGWLIILAALGLAFVSVFLSVASDWWLGVWSDDPDGSIGFYLRVYGALAVGQAVLYLLANLAYMKQCVAAATMFHDTALSAALDSSLAFFEKTPSGRIINRFGFDVDQVDGELNWRIREIAFMFPVMALVMVLVLVVTPAAFAVSLVSLVPLYYIQRIHRSSLRELSRLQSQSYSPINAHISETLRGLTTIRAFGRGQAFRAANRAHIDVNMQTSYYSKYADVWCDIRLEMTGSIVLVVTSVLGLFFFNSHPTLTALAIINADRLIGTLGWGITCFSWLESAMASAERLTSFADLEPERETAHRAPVAEPAWARSGAIEYTEVTMRYRPGLPLALSRVSFSIKSGEKVAVVGRSGSGKTTLIGVLFRLLNLEAGSIAIGGEDIASIPLSELRSALSIIPQESIVFSGTLRENLDPRERYTDAELWDALHAVGLAAMVEGMSNGLSTVLRENASGFSVGQLQLVCLARALLKQARVLVMDEATASCDADTDAQIQATIRSSLADATVLCIAHRLNTVVDYDKVIVMAAGELAEFDSPAALLATPGSIFASMVDETGPETAAHLRRLANDAAARRLASAYLRPSLVRSLNVFAHAPPASAATVFARSFSMATPACDAAYKSKANSPANAVLSGTAANWVDAQYAAWQLDPESVGSEWAEYFARIDSGVHASDAFSPKPVAGPATSAGVSAGELDLTVKVMLLMRAFEVRGHSLAKTDPLGLDANETPPELSVEYYNLSPETRFSPNMLGQYGAFLGGDEMSIAELVAKLRSIYCTTLGFEYMHIQSRDECDFIRNVIQNRSESDVFKFSKEDKVRLFDRLTWSEGFETFLGRKFGVEKRFGLDGCEALIPGMKELIDVAAAQGVKDIVMGMPHRGRLNVLANVVRKPMEKIFREFAGVPASSTLNMGSGDVKYHLGASYTRTTKNGEEVHISLLPNPSHLETVNTVVLGKVRSKQHERLQKDRSRVMPVLLHGDAAFAGQGLVYETLHLSELPNYTVGGCVHIIVNNQVGFTTDPSDGRSSPYCTDVAKTLAIPVVHVNGDDPEAVASSMRFAALWRAKYQRDIVIDVVCYRRYGHNEVDEPRFTQPLMYAAIARHPTVLTSYRKALQEQGVLSESEAQAIIDKTTSVLEERYSGLAGDAAEKVTRSSLLSQSKSWGHLKSADVLSIAKNTNVSREVIDEVARAITTAPPEGFNLHRTLKRIIDAKKAMFEDEGAIDWATAEALAFGSLLLEGTHVRLSGQDVERGTFSHRHAVWHDQKTNELFVPLNYIRPDQSAEDDVEERISIGNSPLDEYAVMGFELGYAMDSPDSLVLWEAQFGDFANGAQVMIDQYLSSCEQKWLYQLGLVLLLPHGYDGMGPEHSSARLERFLQMSDQDPDVLPNDETLVQDHNWQVCNITTPANYFHALRRQIHREFRKPLIVMSPKSLLRLAEAASPISDFTDVDSFQMVLPDARAADAAPAPENIERVVFCSGQVYYDLAKERADRGHDTTAIVRIEQLAPFPTNHVVEQLKLYPNAKPVWAQEEPKNMGAFFHAKQHIATALRAANRADESIIYAGRPAAASPATGWKHVHKAELRQLVDDTFELDGVRTAAPATE
ncbi:uncharacterized protein AMSG_12229 [Thecamonas trahens ATCC 50062]|uniref:2-oxoglutarate dehydrogenase, mitochondrial n=1 Tax=Thecamonas trahens ATCC 50062 TaxID=461836 RepID=A0A0L0DN98_THETB|nr:hypothetical protein AMSG_12229 [Thecamonas trahens ATCC 50062]KNC52888.1 hypothetical protein AMSG_12229 [Thecamonas trahens ATCC 50062]|eukprot:XP_013755015.1 hypothetical protein AMSG_12229 [Thecamonas trahens ATCC 50062]